MEAKDAKEKDHLQMIGKMYSGEYKTAPLECGNDDTFNAKSEVSHDIGSWIRSTTVTSHGLSHSQR